MKVYETERLAVSKCFDQLVQAIGFKSPRRSVRPKSWMSWIRQKRPTKTFVVQSVWNRPTGQGLVGQDFRKYPTVRIGLYQSNYPKLSYFPNRSMSLKYSLQTHSSKGTVSAKEFETIRLTETEVVSQGVRNSCASPIGTCCLNCPKHPEWLNRSM